MRGAPLVLTYHAVGGGPAPLCIHPELFALHLDAFAEMNREGLTISQLADDLHRGQIRPGSVAITFDDGLASVVEHAAPLLAERGLVATVFCVAGRLGSRNDWPSRNPGQPALSLAGPEDLAGLAAKGWEIGSHGLDHGPMDELTPDQVQEELLESKRRLEDAVGQPVPSFAYPYGAVPDGAPEALASAGYSAACTTRLARVSRDTDPFAIPRIDAHYLRRPAMLRATLAGRLGAYLGLRDLGGRARRVVRKDYRPTPS